MEMPGYRQILLQYIDEQESEQPILTKQVVRYVAGILGLEDKNVKKAVNVNMARLEKAGVISRITKGVYCRRIKTAFGYYTPNKETLFCKQLLRDDKGVIGYETGLVTLNRIGLVSQLPKNRCIATNLYTKRIPDGLPIDIRKPCTKVNDRNYRYLQLLDAIQGLDNAPIDAANPAEAIKGAARETALDTDMLILMARKYYSQKTLLRTIDIMLEGKYEASRG